MSADEAKRIADEYYAREKYKKAIPYYEKIVNESRTTFLAEAQLKLAECYFHRKEYIDAIFEYEEFIRQFSEHPDVALAFFQIGVSHYELSLPPHYDQDDTYSAIEAFSEFIDRFPFHEKKQKALEYIKECRYKLLTKKYYNGYAYYKTSDYPSALLYFNEITELNNYDEIDRKSLYYKALIYLYRKDLVNTEKVISSLAEKYPDSKETAKISEKMNHLEKKLNR